LCDANIFIFVDALIYSERKVFSVHFVFLSRVEYQLPNLIVGAVTKESIYGAFENGITAEQVHLYNTTSVYL
jgi:transcription initiation factor TFIIH subunit 4